MDEILEGADIDSISNDNEVETSQEPKKNNSNFAKVISQRNEYKKVADKVPELEKQITELKELVAGKVLQEDEKIEQVRREKEEELYYAKNPDVADFKDDIKATQAKYGMSLDEAKTFVLAQKNPALLDAQLKNRQTNNSPTISGVGVENKPVKDFAEMTDEEFIAWSASQR